MPNSTASSGSGRIPWGKLGLLLLACALLRGFLILAPPDDFFENGAVPHEEMLRGIAAQELLDGPLAPIQRYQVNNFWGGSLVVSILAAVPYAVFGPKLVALRAIALLFGLACVAILFVLLHRHASPRAAWIGAGLLAFAPPGYAMSSCTTYGTHLEANALALLVAWIFLEEQRAPRDGKASAGWLTFALGSSAGFALWFGFSLILVLGVWIAHELARDRMFFARRRAAVLALGFLAGFWPWIRYQLVHGYSGLEIYDQGLAGHLAYGISRGQAAEKLLATFTSAGPLSFCFRDTLPAPGLWVGRVLVCIAVAVLVRCAWLARSDVAALVRGVARGLPGTRATPATFALAFLALFAVTYMLSAFDVSTRDWIFDLRYLMPPVPFVCLAAGIVGAELARHGDAPRRVGTLAAVAIALVCALATARLARTDRYEKNSAAPGSSPTQLLRFLARNFGPEPEEAVHVARRILERRAAPLRDEILAGFGQGVRALAARTGGTEAERRRTAACARTLELVPTRLPPEAARVFAGN
ncbi:MAG: hypothetical protein NTY35_11890 [Planctomycetota bacterium]|nr:hypothetical protein [Planctomycetota bacterium]